MKFKKKDWVVCIRDEGKESVITKGHRYEVWGYHQPTKLILIFERGSAILDEARFVSQKDYDKLGLSK